MISIQELLQNKIQEIGKEKNLNQRQTLIKELYEVYTSPKQKIFRKKENWKRYIAYLKANRINEKTLGQKETLKLWKKKGKDEYKFLKEMSAKELAILLAPFCKKNKNEDVLYYLCSMAKDMDNRNENFSSYLMWSIIDKKQIKV